MTAIQENKKTDKTFVNDNASTPDGKSGMGFSPEIITTKLEQSQQKIVQLESDNDALIKDNKNLKAKGEESVRHRERTRDVVIIIYSLYPLTLLGLDYLLIISIPSILSSAPEVLTAAKVNLSEFPASAGVLTSVGVMAYAAVKIHKHALDFVSESFYARADQKGPALVRAEGASAQQKKGFFAFLKTGVRS